MQLLCIKFLDFCVKKKYLTHGHPSCMIAKVNAMEKIVQQGLLYDFYGQLLTAHQQRIYEDVVLNDLSLSEIAKEQGISRQGVHDLVRRCDKALIEYEEKLRLVQKFLLARKKVEQIRRLTADYLKSGCAAEQCKDTEWARQIDKIAEEIIDGF